MASRSIDPRETVRATLALAARLYAKHGQAAQEFSAALAGQDPGAAPGLVERLAQDPALAVGLHAFVTQHENGLRLLDELTRGFEAALAQTHASLRQLELQRLPLPRLVEAGKHLLLLVERLAADRQLAPLLQPERFGAPTSPHVPTPSERVQDPARPDEPHPPASTSIPPHRTAIPPARTAIPPRTATAPAPAPRLGQLMTLAKNALQAGVPPVADEAERQKAKAAVGAVRGAIDETRHVYTYMAERVKIVAHGVAVYSTPEAAPATVCVGAGERVVAIAEGLARLYRDRPPTLRRSQVAVAQTMEYRRTLFKTEEELARVVQLTPGQALSLVRGINVAVLRGKVIPLTNFGRVFAQDPILQVLFPQL